MTNKYLLSLFIFMLDCSHHGLGKDYIVSETAEFVCPKCLIEKLEKDPAALYY